MLTQSPFFKTSLHVCHSKAHNILILLYLLFFTSFPFLLYAEPGSSSPIAPLYAPLSLVAGRGEEGYRDGEFHESQFNYPAGITFTSTGNQIYLSDRYNYSVRRIRLNKNNQVDTILKSDKPFLAKEKRNSIEPGAIVFLKPQTLVVFDHGLSRLVIFDIDSPTIRTYIPLPERVINMVAIPDRNGVFFTLQERSSLYKVLLESGELEEVPLRLEESARPDLLAWKQDRLLIADSAQEKLYKAEYIEGILNIQEESIPIPAKTQSIFATAKNIFALRASEKYPLVRVEPRGKAENVSLVDSALNHQKVPFASRLRVNEKTRPMALAYPSSNNEVVIALPNENKLIQFNDYDWYEAGDKEITPSADNLYNFSVSEEKPAGTSRILTVGDPSFKKIGSLSKENQTSNDRFDLFSSHLNIKINEAAAFTGISKKYQVLNLTAPTYEDMLAWAPQAVPAAASKYDADHVVFFIVGSHSLSPYFLYPRNEQGDLIYNQEEPNDQFSESLLKDRGLQLFYKTLVETNALNVKSGTLEWASFDQIIKGPDLRSQSKRLLLKSLKQMVLSTTTQLKRTGSFTFVYIPSGSNNCCSNNADFWGELAHVLNARFVDLSPEYTAISETYFPLATNDKKPLFTTTGHRVLAELVAKKLVFE
jgi:hypothetical protein